MQQVLIYADSLSWGIIPTTRRRLAFDERLPGVVETKLNARHHMVRVDNGDPPGTDRAGNARACDPGRRPTADSSPPRTHRRQISRR